MIKVNGVCVRCQELGGACGVCVVGDSEYDDHAIRNGGMKEL